MCNGGRDLVSLRRLIVKPKIFRLTLIVGVVGHFFFLMWGKAKQEGELSFSSQFEVHQHGRWGWNFDAKGRSGTERFCFSLSRLAESGEEVGSHL